MSKISRGYYGYYTTFENKKVFLRSIKEYILALYLDEKKISYEVEPYGLFDKYRPDFLLTNLKTVIEVKDTPNKRKQVLSERQEYYKSKDFRMIAIGNYWHFTKLEKNIPDVKKLKIDWINQNRSNITMNGKNNPMYGFIHTDETKEKIRKKAKERCSDISYRKEMSKRALAFYQTEKGKKAKKQISKRRSAKIVVCVCEICQTPFKVKENKIKRTCSEKCRSKLYSKMVRNNEIRLPKQDKNKAKKGAMIRTLNQWVLKANLKIEDLNNNDTFLNFLNNSQEQGLISKRTSLNTLNRFYVLFEGKEQCHKLIKEIQQYGKIKI